MNILNNIHSHQDLVELNDTQRQQLCAEIREFLVSSVSKTGGHLASNLGVVELTVALETVFDTAKDRLVFDVGHQSYIHKLLTGRQADFASLRQFGGMAGFPKPGESDADAFVAGHASSSVSIALGMARARTLSKGNYRVVALLGDGAATGGMVYEGLNDAAVSGEPMVVVLNDNAMSIDRNVGGVALHLSRLRTKEKYLGMKKKYNHFLSKIPGGHLVFRLTRNIKDRIRRMLIPSTIFESMGLTYLGPVDGHDTERLISLLRAADDMKRPVLVHVLTQKGRGYAPAEANPAKFHGIGKFDPLSGEVAAKSGESFSEVFGKAMVRLAENNPSLCAITAAMPGGTGLLAFKQKYPKRTFDVGIAEEHAVSMACGLAKQGFTPVVAIYSTFLQRAYDMILQDAAMLGLHVVFAVDRAGLVGEDGETHHGLFDVGFLRHAPGLTVLCPASLQELDDMLAWSVNIHQGPVAIRYPRGGNGHYTDSAFISTGSVSSNSALACHKRGDNVLLITYGKLINQALSAAAILEEKGVNATVLRLLTVAPLPLSQINAYMGENTDVFVLEETLEGCGIGSVLSAELMRNNPNCRVFEKNLGDRYVCHGSMDSLYNHYGLDANSIAEYVQEVLKVEN